MDAMWMPLASKLWRAVSRSINCDLQNGHQSADRLKRISSPFGPERDCNVCGFPSWSLRLKEGIFTPGCRPESSECAGTTPETKQTPKRTIQSVSFFRIDCILFSMKPFLSVPGTL